MERLDGPLPNEVREMIIGLLAKTDLISIAGTSRYSRDRLLPKLFESLFLRVGIPLQRRAGEVIADEVFRDDVVDDGDKVRYRRTKEVLQRLAEPDRKKLDIASFVRELRIRIIDESYQNTKQKEHILLALKRLPELRHFSWCGRTIPDEVTNLLRRFPPQCSISLRMRGGGDGDGFVGAVQSLAQIQEFDLVDDREELAGPHSILEDRGIRALIARHWHSLRRLALDENSVLVLNDQIRGRGQSSLSTNLTHLVLVLGFRGDFVTKEDLRGIEAVFRQVSALESLTLLKTGTLCFLPLGYGNLPKLKELKIGVERDMEIQYQKPDMHELVRTLRDFVYSHKNLRRFDFMMWVTWMDECAQNDFGSNAEWFSFLVDAVHSLDHLTALGLTFPGMLEADMQAALERVIGHEPLKRTCRALRLGALTDIPMQISLTGFSQCSFFAVSNGRPMENTESRYAPPSVRRLVSVQNDCRLRQVCLNGRLYDVLVADPDGSNVVTKRWSALRLHNRTENDFCSVDGHWLMSYRDISERYEVARSYELDDEGYELDDENRDCTSSEDSS